MSLLLICATAVFGQARYDVPFAFQAGGQSFAAGQYRISTDSMTRGLSIMPESGGSITLHVQNKIDGTSVLKSGKLVFTCYKDSSCFLSQVWRGGDTVGMQLPETRVERQIAETTPQVASTIVARK
jgi:hypothetical protein